MKTIRYSKLAIIMAVSYQLLLILLLFLRPDIHPYWHTISEWAMGKYGWLMQTAFICSGLSYFFLFQSMRNEVNGKWGKTGLALLLICTIGTIGVGLFVTDPYPPDFSISATLVHTICGTLAMSLFPLAAFIITQNLRKKNEHWKNEKSLLKWLCFLPLLAFTGFIIHLNLFVIPLGENAVGESVPIGYPPRVMFLTYHIWLITVGFKTIKINNSIQKQYGKPHTNHSRRRKTGIIHH